MILEIGIALGLGCIVAGVIVEVLRRRRRDKRTGQYEEEPLTTEEEKTLERLKKMRPPVEPVYPDYPLDDGARFDARSGAIIYKDSEVIRPYIGSEEEERDADRARIPKPPKSREGEWPLTTCPTCFGVKRLNFGLGKPCPDCKGSGSMPARNK